MMTEQRFVFDTNAIVSAVLLKKSVSRRAFDAARRHGSIIISVDVLNEFNDVLRRTKFNKYVTERERLQFLSGLVREAILIEHTVTINECRDPKDDMFLELAVSGMANYIVSGDKDLLVLHPFRGIPVVTAREFMDIIR